MYTWEKFYRASKGLKQTKLNPRKALEYAYTSHLIMLREDDFPEELVEDFRKIENAVNLPPEVTPIGKHSGCSRAISGLSEEEVQETISLIHEVYDRLESIKGNNA